MCCMAMAGFFLSSTRGRGRMEGARPAPPEGCWFFLVHQAGQTNQSLARHTGLESYTASEVWSRVCLGAASGIPAHHLYDTISHSLMVSVP